MYFDPIYCISPDRDLLRNTHGICLASNWAGNGSGYPLVFTTTINPFKRLAAAHKTSAAGQQHDRHQLTSPAAHQATTDIIKTQRRQLTSAAANQATTDISKRRDDSRRQQQYTRRRRTSANKETTAYISCNTPGSG
jgi:hypothetical protein